MSTPLRGRAAELSAVRELIDAGTGMLAFAGGPGIGKTALLLAAADYAREQGVRVLWLTGTAAETSLRYAGLHALLQGLSSPGPLPAAGGLALPAAVHALLTSAAPVVCCVDDISLVDGATRDVLAFAARRGVALITTGSSGRVLEPLDADAMAELIADLLPVSAPDGLRDALARASLGNPLALVELAGSLTAEQLAGTAPPPRVPPRSGRLWRLLLDEVMGLPFPTRSLLLLVAAEPGLAVDTLIRAAGGSLAALEPAERLGMVLVEDGRLDFRNPLLGPVLYEAAPLERRRAAHRLLSMVLDRDDDLLRRAWHRAAALDEPEAVLAAELEEAAAAARAFAQPADVSRVLERAAELTPDHRTKATRLVAAARAAWMAGQSHRAQRLLAGFQPLTTDVGARAQAGLVRGNLELRGGLTVTARDELLAAAERLVDRDRVLAVRTLMRAGEASYLAGDHRRYLAVARDAAALRRSDDPVSAQVMFEYLDGMAATFQGRHREAARPLRRVLELTSSVDSPSILVWATVAGLLLGEDAQALKLSGQALSTARDQGAVAAIPQIIEFLVHTQLWMGSYEALTGNAIEGLRLAEDTGQLNTAAQHLSSLALVSAIQGDTETAQVRSQAALKLAAAHRVGVVEARGAWALAYLDLAAGRHREAAARLRTATWNGHGQGHLVIQVMATPQFVEAAARIGETAEATEALGVFERWVSSTRSPDRLALAARCRALLALPSEASELYGEALDLHQQGACAFERARTQLLYGGALRRARHRRNSREHLHGALETFERLGARSWAEQARAELRASGESVRPRQRATTADLTPQQLQIARLVAAGATNREIAGKLYLSHRTVEHHLSKIFAKLEIRSRVELAKLL